METACSREGFIVIGNPVCRFILRYQGEINKVSGLLNCDVTTSRILRISYA